MPFMNSNTGENVSPYEGKREKMFPYTREQEAELVVRMKAGDREARDQFVEYLQPYLRMVARKYAATYYWVSSFMDYDNILSELNYQLLVLLVEKGAMETKNPVGYIRKCLPLKIADYCFCRVFTITMPTSQDLKRTGDTAVHVASLDEPLENDPDMTLVDTLDPGSVTTAPVAEKDFGEVYQALDRALTPHQRTIVGHRHGLPGYGYANEAETAYALGISPHAVGTSLHKARGRLRADSQLCVAVGMQG